MKKSVNVRQGVGEIANVKVLTRLRRPRLPPSGRCASTSRSWGSSLSLSTWWTRTCLPGVSHCRVSITALHTPLQIVRPWVLVFAVWAEGTDVAR
jgi:hypothetical protein